MIPVIVLVKILELLGATHYLAEIISPIMSFVGLPPELGIVWAGTLLSNIYTGMVLFISAPVSADLTVIQVTVLGILMLIAHSLPVELRVAQKIGVSIGVSMFLRVAGAYLAAWIYLSIVRILGVSEIQAQILWNPVIAQQDLWQWAVSQIKLLMQIVIIISALVVLLKLIKALKIDRLIQFIVRPILPLLGLTDKAINITLVGFTLGLTYGAGLLIQESRSGKLGAKELFFTVCLLLICHGLIEDTLLILLLGADIYGVLVFRLIFSIGLIAMLVFALRSKGDQFFSKYLLNRNFQSGLN